MNNYHIVNPEDQGFALKNGCKYTRITNFSVRGGTQGLRLGGPTSTAAQQCEFITFDTGMIESISGNGFHSNAGGACRDSMMTNVHIVNCSDWGAKLRGSRWLMSGCYFYGNTTGPFEITSDGVGCIAPNNYASSAPTVASGHAAPWTWDTASRVPYYAGQGVTSTGDSMTGNPESDTEDGYIEIEVNGTRRQIPFYNA